MFKKGPDIDKKKLLSKASDVKKDSLTRLKHFKTLIEHLDYNEITSLFNTHFSFIYHTFIDTFSNFDCNSKQRREDLDCLLFMFEKILIYNSKLVRKRWQFYSITFVMQKLLHQDNTHKLRQEGVRLFVLWYEILCDESNIELQTMFRSIVPDLIDNDDRIGLTRQLYQMPPQNPSQSQYEQYDTTQLPIKLCSVDPLVALSPNEQLPTDRTTFYLECLLHYMVTQTTKPFWNSQDEEPKNQEQSFSFLFDMFKKIYMPYIFPNISVSLSQKARRSQHPYDSVNQFVDESIDSLQANSNSTFDDNIRGTQSYKANRLSTTSTDGEKQMYLSPQKATQSIQERVQVENLSSYQAVVIRWLTRILRQDVIPGQEELIKASGLNDSSDNRLLDRDSSYLSESNSTTNFQNMETTSQEMEIARKVIGTWPENISIVHEIFRRAFLDFLQPASMKRVVNVYKEWICSGKVPTQPNPQLKKIGYTSFGDLLQVFVMNSSNAFLTQVNSPALLDEQVEMCKRIMNIYRFMVMKIYMNTTTWEHLLCVMLSITEQLFPRFPPEQKECTIGGRIAPAFFQTFIVSWIRANLYVHISNRMWLHFHRVMKNLILWRELVEEWSTTMNSLTRVLVKNVYGLNLNDLPLDRPQDRRRRTRTVQSFSTTGSIQNSVNDQQTSHPNPTCAIQRSQQQGAYKPAFQNQRRLTRSNSESVLVMKNVKLDQHFQRLDSSFNQRIRKIKSEYLLHEANPAGVGRRSSSPSHTDVLDGPSLKDPAMMIDQVIESQITPKPNSEIVVAANKKLDKKSSPDKCVLLGGTIRGWTIENSIIMWRRMLGLFGNINHIDSPENHLVSLKCLAVVICEFIKTRENLGVSLDNQSTPEQPSLIPPYTYPVAWLLEATLLPNEYRESRLLAYKLLCFINIRRHDKELSPQYYSAFYEALYRGLNSSDPVVYSSIIRNSARMLTLELPGCTFLVNSLFERSRSIIMNNSKETSPSVNPQDQAIDILNSILSLYRPIRKLMVLGQESGNTGFNLVAPSDFKTKIIDTFVACTTRQSVMDNQTRSRLLFSMAMHIYQELSEKHDCPDIDRLFDIILLDLQRSSFSDAFRVNCDLVKLFAEHATGLSQNRPEFVCAMLQAVCHLIVKFGTSSTSKEAMSCLLICLDDWCMSLGKNFLLKPLDDEEESPACVNETLLSIILKSLDAVIYGQTYLEDQSSKPIFNQGTNQHSRVSSHQEIGSNPLRDRTLTNESQDPATIGVATGPDREDKIKSIRLACQVTSQKLLTLIGHYPLRQLGTSSLSCFVNEIDYFSENEQEITRDLSVLVVDGSTIISFVGDTSSEKPNPNAAHLILRNPSGKYAWDINMIGEPICHFIENDLDSLVVDPDTFQQEDSRSPDSDMNADAHSGSSISSRSSIYRDQISDLLNHLTNSSTSGSSLTSNQSLHKKRNSAMSISNSKFKVAQAEETMIALLVNQRFQELNYCEKSGCIDRVVLRLGNTLNTEKDPTKDENDHQGCEQNKFDLCRQLIQQFGYLSWEKRSKIDSLKKSARLIREFKNLDSQPNRETHKIAVIYVANGQEDKQSILSNSTGSSNFEEFVAGLGWEVSVNTHLGFKGGLQANKSSNETSLYYCTSSTEVMFHVSTRMPINDPTDDESLNRKLRHLGNDEIHIVWSEHGRDYRRGIIPTEFGDVIIVIYSMLTFSGYYRIQILSKPEVPIFGPLFDNCIVHQTNLAPLVRATAINASRAKRLDMPHYLAHFEERSRLIEAIVQNHKARLSFEDFAVQLYQLNY